RRVRGACAARVRPLPDVPGGVSPLRTGVQRRPVGSAGLDTGRFLTGRQLCRGNIQGVRWTEFARDDELEFKGQMGQESNLQPAVLELSARCPDSSKVV